MSSPLYISESSLRAVLLTKLQCKPDGKGATSECDWWRTAPGPRAPDGVVFPVMRPEALPESKPVHRLSGKIEYFYSRVYVTDLLRQIAVMYGAPLAVRDDDPEVKAVMTLKSESKH